MENELESETRDMMLAACYIVEGIKYLRVEHEIDNPRRLIFIFENHPDIVRIKSERANGTHVVSSTVYDNALRSMKSIVHGG